MIIRVPDFFLDGEAGANALKRKERAVNDIVFRKSERSVDSGRFEMKGTMLGRSLNMEEEEDEEDVEAGGGGGRGEGGACSAVVL
jgi:hypothetical protein